MRVFRVRSNILNVKYLNDECRTSLPEFLYTNTSYTRRPYREMISIACTVDNIKKHFECFSTEPILLRGDNVQEKSPRFQLIQ